MQYYIYEGQNLNDIHNERERDQEMAQVFRWAVQEICLNDF